MNNAQFCQFVWILDCSILQLLWSGGAISLCTRIPRFIRVIQIIIRFFIRSRWAISIFVLNFKNWLLTWRPRLSIRTIEILNFLSNIQISNLFQFPFAFNNTSEKITSQDRKYFTAIYASSIIQRHDQISNMSKRKKHKHSRGEIGKKSTEDIQIIFLIS